MRTLSAEETADRIGNLVHLETQAAVYGLDLTAASIYRITGAGELDFGGSEFEEAARERLEPELAQPDDDYGWWDLREGTYFARYNESVQTDDLTLIHPHERLLQTGARHPAFRVHAPTEPLETVLTVPERGVRIKENARISRLVVLEA